MVEERRHLELTATEAADAFVGALVDAGHVEQGGAAADVAELLDVAGGVVPGDVEVVAEPRGLGHGSLPS
jgi:hypothetical protein